MREDTSSELVLPPQPTREQLTEKVRLLADMAVQLQTLAETARAALTQHRQEVMHLRYICATIVSLWPFQTISAI